MYTELRRREGVGRRWVGEKRERVTEGVGRRVEGERGGREKDERIKGKKIIMRALQNRHIFTF